MVEAKTVARIHTNEIIFILTIFLAVKKNVEICDELYIKKYCKKEKSMLK